MMNLGKRILSFCLCAVMLMLLISCASSVKAVVGRWETEIVDEELGKVAMVYHFTDDGEIFLEQKKDDTIPFSIPFGSFSVKGQTLTIESDGAKEVYTFSVSKDRLVLEGKGDLDLVFTRV